MSVYVEKGRNSIEFAISDFLNAMKKDYYGWGNRLDDTLTNDPIREKMYVEYCENLTYSKGSKYIKVFAKGGGVKAFIVNTESDKKFKKGDILKPAGWAAPARNFARGNILDGGYPINWTGPVYLK